VNKESGKLVATAKLTAMNIYPRIAGLDGSEKNTGMDDYLICMKLIQLRCRNST
jgi:hypothetical protein